MTFAGTIDNINAALNGLTFWPTMEYEGSAALDITVTDTPALGGIYEDFESVPISIDGVIVSNSVETTINTPLVFTFADFCLNVNPSDFTGIRIVSLPPYGTFKLNGEDVTENQFISAEDIENGLLVFTPDVNASGVPFSSFYFRLVYAGSGLETWDRHMYIDVFGVGG